MLQRLKKGWLLNQQKPERKEGKAMDATTEKPPFVPILDLYGVKLGSTDVDDHPQFPQPRSDLGDLKALAAGIVESGRRDQAITVWDRDGELILLDGKRTVTAMLRFPELRKALHGQLPVMWWEPKDKAGELTAEQQAQAYMIRVNLHPDGVRSGRKLLTLQEEIDAASRLRETGLSYEAVGKALDCSGEHARKILNPNLTPEVKAAVGQTVTPETPLGKEQALALAKESAEKQRETVQKAAEVVRAAQANGEKVSRKAVAQGAGIRTKDNRKPRRGFVPKQAKVQDVPTPKIVDKPQTAIEWVELIISELTQATDGPESTNIEGILNRVKRAKLAAVKYLKPLLESGGRKAKAERRKKAAV